MKEFLFVALEVVWDPVTSAIEEVRELGHHGPKDLKQGSAVGRNSHKSIDYQGFRKPSEALLNNSGKQGSFPTSFHPVNNKWVSCVARNVSERKQEDGKSSRVTTAC